MGSVILDDVLAAAGRLEGVARRTPIVTCRTLNELAGAQVNLKSESFQRTGSFKFRGAYNALSQLSEQQRGRGVITYSSGNHAQALACAGRLLGCRVTIVMPRDAPRVKREATEGYGGEVIEYDRDETSREELGIRLAAERGLTLVPPYDHPHVVAGQGTVALELIQDSQPLDLLLVCLGGGGLLSGCAVAAKALSPRCRVVGVEPANADDGAQSFRSRELKRVENPDTIADGARTPSLGQVTFPLILEHVDAVVTVSESEIVAATRLLWERAKLVVEPTGALAVAALVAKRVEAEGLRIGAVVSGGNADVGAVSRLFEEA
ncbi:MAG: threo-3-hydroxy-L-aspartate ammonia-lyase [Fimbriimonadaceae bacterium]|nr:threo-3-hydroxy-L-aspartate ammonia-lyase [Fimbriimonadaceae bacterium]QYK59210.1 MAG: threo-3-hydroxy-L-aspartate ammonia-lyase [Fimbriimonadaceae bacterium]